MEYDISSKSVDNLRSIELKILMYVKITASNQNIVNYRVRK
jgi:hypothetical protein